jgi:predicted amidohydrolase
MNLVCFQLDIVWEDKSANHDKVRALLDAAAPPRGSLVLLPEMFATGFSMNAAAISDSATRYTQDFLARAAVDYGVYLLGGLVTTAIDGRGRNECVIFSPDGVEIARYCKLHPFAMGGEAEHYAAGDEICLFDWQGFTVSPFICYDLRFPEVFRAAVQRGANLFTVIASWPSLRESHWLALLKARAIENQAYVAGVNRCGTDPHLPYSGRTIILDPRGEVLAEAGSAESTINAQLDLPALLSYRREFPALRDMRPDLTEATEVKQ